MAKTIFEPKKQVQKQPAKQEKQWKHKQHQQPGDDTVRPSSKPQHQEPVHQDNQHVLQTTDDWQNATGKSATK